MTPKEKATELVYKYWGKGITNDKEIAKQCALIAVQEILSVIDGLFTEPYLDSLDEKEYWQQVRTEIENL